MKVEILKSVWADKPHQSGYRLGLQKCKFTHYRNDKIHWEDEGFRFIELKPNGDENHQEDLNKKPEQTLFSPELMFELVHQATKEGWFISCEKE